ncbi:hypothetical protein ACK3TF_005218 [Chlorella vulgaris]
MHSAVLAADWAATTQRKVGSSAEFSVHHNQPSHHLCPNYSRHARHQAFQPALSHKPHVATFRSEMAAALAACPTVARPGTTINVAARRSSFYSGSARLTAAPRAANHALVAARARQAVTVEARAAKAAGQITVDVEKPLGLVLDQSRSPKGGLVVKSVSGNAAKARKYAALRQPASCVRAGIQAGDTVIYTSSFFGDELWPADKLGFARSAIQAAPSPVSLVLVRGPNDSVDVKKLPKKPAPARFGRRLTAAQKARATHLCVDCGYIYSDELPFEQTATDYRCPQCNAPKRRFARFNVETGKVQTSDTTDLGTIATVIGGLLGVGILGYLGFSL